MNLICFFKGHEISEETDGGYEHCKRCKSHEYYNGYDSDCADFYLTLPSILANIIWRLKWWLANKTKTVYEKCCDCGKTKRVLGRHIGNHDKCMPF